MVIEYCRPSWPGKHSPAPWKAQKTQKRFLTPFFRPSLKGRGVLGYAHPNGKQIDLYPDAFSSPDTLIRTLGHERTHAFQFKTFGPAKDSVMSGRFEDAAYGIEDAFILHWKRSR